MKYIVREYFKGILEDTTVHHSKEAAESYGKSLATHGTEWEIEEINAGS